MAKDYRHSFSDWFPSRRRSVNPKPSPRQQALKDRLAVLGIGAGMERVGGHWDVWYDGCTAECANLTEAAWAVEDFEQVAKEGADGLSV